MLRMSLPRGTRPLTRACIPIAITVVMLATLAGCSPSPKTSASSPSVTRSSGSPSASASEVPPIPSTSGQSLGPNQPPIVWVGGTITDVKQGRLELREAFGSVVTLRRLGGEATTFYRISSGTWDRADPAAFAKVGTKACVETLMDGRTLLALRVFLGADCGPSV